MTWLTTTYHTGSQESVGVADRLGCMWEPDPGIFKPVDQGVVEPPHGRVTGSVVLAVVGVLLGKIGVLVRQAVLVMRIFLLTIVAS